ncbi:hypothetical protein ACFY2Z_30170 [Streptomyces sp. NPDC001222]|uniref:hypothetical protein n=1 Tax=Streptomyces sp. NPDC001222 TaxID=3364548 RepID=UPI0036A57654
MRVYPLGAESARRLAQAGLCEFEPGLTGGAFPCIEREYGFEGHELAKPGFAMGSPWLPLQITAHRAQLASDLVPALPA